MKKILTYLTIALGLIVGFGNRIMADPSLPQITVSLKEDGYDKPEEEPRGWRMPAVPLTCTIDFTDLSITADRLPVVLSYELLDETGDKMIISYSNDYDMVVFMSSLVGVYQLHLVLGETSYIGYTVL